MRLSGLKPDPSDALIQRPCSVREGTSASYSMRKSWTQRFDADRTAEASAVPT